FGAGGAGAAGARGSGVAAGAGVTGGTATTGLGDAHTQGTGAAGTGGVEGAGARDPTESRATGAGGSGTGGAGVGGPGVGGAGAGGAGDVGPGGTVRPRPYFVPLLQQPAFPLPAPSPYNKQSGGLIEHREPASRPVSPILTTRCVPLSRPPPLPGTHTMTLRLSSVPLRVPLPAPPESSLPEVPDLEPDRTRAASPTVSRLLATIVTDPSFESAVASALVAELLDSAAACCLDYASALVAESTCAGPPSVEGTYVDEVPPPGANIVDGMWIFRVKQPPGSPPAFKAHYVARGFSQRQGVDYFHTFSPTPKMTSLRVLLHVAAQHDYELHSLDFSTVFLQGSLHEEIWLRRPPVRTTLMALGFAPSTADPSLFLRIDTSLPSFYVLVYIDDLIYATADTEAQALVKSELQKRHTCIDLGELRSYLGVQITRDRARRTITLTQSHMVQQVLQHFGSSSPCHSPLLCLPSTRS
ncbi:unnamed protein product, partial [Closterium sp. NIES-54]